MKRNSFSFCLVAAAFLLEGQALAQLPSGSDITTAIPIYFNEMTQNMGDVTTAPLFVYSITLSKGQQITGTLSIAASAPDAEFEFGIYPPTVGTLANCRYSGSMCANSPTALAANWTGNGGRATSFTYTASASGVYYIPVVLGSHSVTYTLEVTTTTLPSSSPNCSGGTLTGQVDYITYSLTLIAAGLPDSASVGGTQLCASCTIKAPAYPQIAEKMESAMSLNVPVALCYDGSGNINQITLKHP